MLTYAYSHTFKLFGGENMRIQRVSVMILLTVCLTLAVQAEKLGVLKDVLKPESISILGDRLCVIEGATFYVYSIKDLKLVGKFGKEGEGPGELTVSPFYVNSAILLPGAVYVEGVSKVLTFGTDFTVKKELKKKGMLKVIQTLPLDGKLVGVRNIMEGDSGSNHILTIMDENTDVIKELNKLFMPEKGKEQNLAVDTIHFDVYKGNIYVEESDKGFFIQVFNGNGEKIKTIQQDSKGLLITDADKAAMVDDFKNDNTVQFFIKGSGGWENFKKTIEFTFPARFPAIRDLLVRDDKIYVETFEIKDNKRKFVVMNLDGKLLSTVYLPLPRNTAIFPSLTGRIIRNYGIADNTYYYLLENDETEDVELHSLSIK